jgi:uncharacterized protein YndB with AHSA1/START domain
MAIAGDQLEHEVLIAAPPEIVFAFFTDPELYSRWMGREATPTARGSRPARSPVWIVTRVSPGSDA